jgi:hypothetical protein
MMIDQIRALAFALPLVLAACSEDNDLQESSEVDAMAMEAEAEAIADEAMEGSGYQNPITDMEALDNSGLTFEGYECTEDCSGHEAGYAWAEDNDITDPDDCGGNSNSFYEGCVAYAEE